MSDPVLEWYGEFYDEQSRLSDHELEFVRAKRIIARYLPDDPITIADIGGAAGAYSFWLAGLGHQVSLIDLTPRHIELAQARAQATGVHLNGYFCADARQLPCVDESFDMVLVMGPLYHLQSSDDRQAVLREALRVVKPGHHVVCQVISRWASLVDGFKHGFVMDDYFHQIMDADMRTGCHENPKRVQQYFTTAYFHRPNEIMDELLQAGFRGVSLAGVEGFASPFDARQLMADSARASALLECLDATESVPELLGVSSHIMAIGTKP